MTVSKTFPAGQADALPTAAGYAMPPEWAPHDRCWMAWPCRADVFNGRLEEARLAYAAVAQAIRQFEPVTMVVRPENLAEMSITCGTGVRALPLDHDDSWLRDNGPTFLTAPGGRVGGVCWRWNAWGGLYRDHAADAAVAGHLLTMQGLPAWMAAIVMEGGAIHVDGEGTLLTTEECLLNPNRNGNLDRADIEGMLRGYLGVETIIWLGRGWVEDETSGHVDNVAMFVAPGVVLAQSARDPADPNHAIWVDNKARLAAARDAKGRSLQIVEVEQPRPRQRRNGSRTTASYVNLYLANGGVILPAFEDPQDQAAFATVSRLFPERQVVQVPASDIVEGGGGIHCITQQQPSSVL